MQLNSKQIKLIMEIDEDYNQIMQADEFVKGFETIKCFENWCNMGEIIDLKEALPVFEAFELYEHCAVIKKLIDKKLQQ